MDDLKFAILDRATEIMQCSMADDLLIQCQAQLVTQDGCAWFEYDRENFSYEVRGENDEGKANIEVYV